ncbi:MAG TPA: CocE/NonD family hydrolase, partial [Patescibacteria group bacterium]|nr:CocE/NonD family hydrolase [Patescibacteria group bacterium]
MPSKPEYDAVVSKDVMVKMHDGTLLATDIYRPSRKGKVPEERFPTVLMITPYNKEDPVRARDVGEWFCKRGYVVVIQDFRGRFKSEGIFYKYANMGEDGYETVEWIAKQRWSNGKIGTIGHSYMAHFQIAVACLSPPHLSAMIVVEGGFSNAFFSSCRHMGAFEIRQLVWTFTAAANSREAACNPAIRTALESVNPADYLDPTREPLKEGETPLSLVPPYERFYFDMLTKSEYTEYWRKIGLCAEEYYDAAADVPTLLIGGWYDPNARLTSDIYVGLSKRKKGPIRLIFGHWIHGWQYLEST